MSTSMTGSSERYPAIDGCVEACRRCSEVLKRVPPELFGDGNGDASSMGAHIRHCLDHFACFFDGWATGEIDYDARERDAAVELAPENALAVLTGIEESLRTFPMGRLGERVMVRQTVDAEGDVADMESTVGRELVFLSGHTIHHLALIDLMAREHGVTFSETFSMAFSTAAYRVASGRASR